jgi:hypothetical protein
MLSLLLRSRAVFLGLSIAGPLAASANAEPGNLLADPSFERTMPRDQFGHVFKEWGGWKYEGECEFRVGRIAHTGNTSCLLFGASQPKIRISQTLKALPAGRYKVTAWLRGLDIGEGQWHMTTEMAFGDKYMHLKKNGTFGWTPLTYVVEVKESKDSNGPAFGLWGPGYLWIDDVSVTKVTDDVPLTPEPVLGNEERPIQPPGAAGEGATRCPECGYKNMPAWRTCYACGSELTTSAVAGGPAIKPLTSFEHKSPFAGGQIVAEHASDGSKALRIDKDFVSWNAPQDWSGYDYLKADLFTDADKPLPLSIELRDRETRDYWTRVNYETIVPPGRSTLVLPLAQLYVGEKSRPGRNLLASAVTHLVFIVGPHPPASLYLDNVRLERDTETSARLFNGLLAFDFGPANSPTMPGFTRIDPATTYSRGRGYGLKDARVWRGMDVKQPDPLYQDYLSIEQGGLAVDVPNGRYHVFANIDNPSGFWGEYQTYRQRAVLAEGRPVVEESMTFDSLKKKYFRNWDTEDSPLDNTFDKYQRAYYQEKEFDVEVADGQLNIEFRGENVGCSVSAVVIYPLDKSDAGRKFLDYVAKKQRFFFDNYFHRILHKPTGEPLEPKAADTERGYVVFARDAMQDVHYNDTPRSTEIDQPLVGSGFAGEYEPLSVAICPLADLGPVTASISDLVGPGKISSADIAVGYVSNRLTRVSGDGAVYTIAPRLIVPRPTVDVRKGVARRFWLTVHPPADAVPGIYHGQVTIAAVQGKPAKVEVEYRVYAGTLDAVDIPVGPWSHEINIPWDGGDAAAQAWNETMAERSLRHIRGAGFTTVSGLPRITYHGFKDGKPLFDFQQADRQMALARQVGFTMPVVTYTDFVGLNVYAKDVAAMQAAGFSDYSQFVKAVFTAIQTHADSAAWLPVYWNLGDEPLGDDLVRSAENAEAYRAAFSQGPPLFTGATSFSSASADDPHYRFAKALHVANVNDHNAESIRMLQQAGSQWAFYNGGNRWTYGTYLYKAAKEFDMKFRLSWHWNAVAGDPYYALDCREDDYAWCNANAEGELIPSIAFEREMRSGIDDYRYLLTLARLAAEKHDEPAQALIAERMSAFKLGQREHDELFPTADWSEYRKRLAEAIERLQPGDL